MTLGELIDRYRLHLEGEPVGVRRSWEDTFRYAVRHYPPETDLAEFDLDVLAARLIDEGIQPRFVDGYITRWRGLLSRAGQL